MNRLTFVGLLLSSLLLTSCSRSGKVVLTSQDGTRSLVYDPEHFVPQAQTPEDIRILMDSAGKTIQEAAAKKHVLVIKDIGDAMRASDWRGLERILVEYKAKRSVS